MEEASPAPHSSRQLVSDESPPESGSSQYKKRRGAIATQACDTCRHRKQRCDEERPKCSTCVALGTDCRYREAPPTKKDKTMVEILGRVIDIQESYKRVEIKLETALRASSHQAFPSASVAPAHFAHPETATLESGHQAPPVQLPDPSSLDTGSIGYQYKYCASVHEMTGWPAVKKILVSFQHRVPHINMSTIDQDGVATMLAIHRAPEEMVSTGPRGPLGQPTAPSSLEHSWEHFRNLSQAYFDTFNPIYPILDRHTFLTKTLPDACKAGFPATASSVIAILVFALGEVSLAGFEGMPLHVYNGRGSGVRGGTKDRPPGIEWFNDARQRIGFHLTSVSHETVQMCALAGAYYGSCFCPSGFWRMSRAASQACQDLIDSDVKALSGKNADLVRRLFWHCSIMETCLNLELRFPLPGLDRLEKVVGTIIYKDADLSDADENIKIHFASQIALRRMLVDFHNKLSQGTGVASSSPAWTRPTTIIDVISQSASELEEWRGMLPARFKWLDDSSGASTNTLLGSPTEMLNPNNTPISPMIIQQHVDRLGARASFSQIPLQPIVTFNADLDAPPVSYPYALDMQAALLQSRYYYTKHLIYRPYMYKALHYPGSITDDDAEGVMECLRAGLKWPIAMSPVCKHKRLIPCMFFFTQSFFGILTLLNFSMTVPVLKNIRRDFGGEQFDRDAGETIELYLDWLRDLKEIDVGTAWHWDVAKALYGISEE